MQFQSSIATLTVCFILFHQTHALLNLAGWQSCKEEKLISDVVALAHSHVSRSFGVQSPVIEVTKMEKQVLLGTNFRLQFVFDGKKKCELTAVKPWSFTLKPLTLQKCTCQDKPKTEQPVVPDWDDCTEDSTVSEVAGLAHRHVSRTYNLKTPLIRAIQLKKQILFGTNLRFQFLLDGKKKCELTAVRPWLFTLKPLEVKSCSCEEEKIAKPVVSQWEICNEDKLVSEMIGVAQNHVALKLKLLSPVIQVVQLKKQILEGTNLHFQFLLNGKKKCELKAVKPWSFTLKPVEVNECTCEETEEEIVEQPIVADWEDCNEDKSISEMVGVAESHVVHHFNVVSPLIKVLELKKQIVSGTNFRLQFVFDGKKKCKLNAFKPLPQTNKPIEVKDCSCEDTTNDENDSKSNSKEN